jgi:hypothetical protein
VQCEPPETAGDRAFQTIWTQDSKETWME